MPRTASVGLLRQRSACGGRGRNSPCGGEHAAGRQNALRCDGRCSALHAPSQHAASAFAACCAFRAAVLHAPIWQYGRVCAVSLRVTSIILPLSAYGSSSFSSVPSPFSSKPFSHHPLVPPLSMRRLHLHFSLPLACLCANLFVTLPAEMPPFAQSMPRH